MNNNVVAYSPIKKENKIQHHNDLIYTFAKMNYHSRRIFEVVVSCIDPENHPKDNKVILNKQELFKYLGYNASDRYTKIEERIRSFQKELLEVEINGRIRSINLTSEAEWSISVNDNYLHIQLSESIMPYLLEYRKHFVAYQLSESVNLLGKYSLILYKYLISIYNQYEFYKDGNSRTSKQLHSYQNPVISLDELRSLTNTGKKLKETRNLLKVVLDDSLDEINKKTSINVKYDKLKKGVPIVAIQFRIEKKDPQILDPFYKANIEESKKDRQAKEDEKLILLPQALQNTYIQLLVKEGLLDFSDVDNLVKTFKRVVPIYQELWDNFGGFTGNPHIIEDHINYVKENMIATNGATSNISKYLEVAADQYLNRLRENEKRQKKILDC